MPLAPCQPKHPVSGFRIKQSRLFADYPSLGRGIILQQQQPQQLEEQLLQNHHNHLPDAAAAPPSQRRRPTVLLKPQYACFLQHDNEDARQQTTHPPAVKRKAASFSLTKSQREQPQREREQREREQDQREQQQLSNYITPTTTTAVPTVKTAAITNCSNRINIGLSNRSRHRSSLPIATHLSTMSSSLALPNASTTLLQARIPGNTLYYV